MYKLGLLLVLLAAPCAAEVAESRPFRLPLLIDGTYTWRTAAAGDGWHGGDAMVRVPVGTLFGDLLEFSPRVLSPHQASFSAGFERAYGLRPNPQRAWVTTGYNFGVDFYSFERREGLGGSLSSDGAFPMSRSITFSFGAGVALGYEYRSHTESQAVQHLPRVQTWGWFGVSFVELHGDVAFTFNPGKGRRVTHDLALTLRIGRPLLPFSVNVGISGTGFENGGGAWFTLGAGFAL